MPVRHYPAIVEGDAESGYSVFFPDFPGYTSGGDTLQEAALNAEEGLAARIALMLVVEIQPKIPDARGLRRCSLESGLYPIAVIPMSKFTTVSSGS